MPIARPQPNGPPGHASAAEPRLKLLRSTEPLPSLRPKLLPGPAVTAREPP